MGYAQAAMPTPDEFSRWLQGYRDAFIDFDAESAGELFSDDAMYCESPFAPPIHGRSNIVAYWRMVARVMRDVEFGFEVLATTDDIGVARVNDALTRVPSGRRVRYDGIFFARFDEELRCEEFREWWVELPVGSEPATR
jgi:hypothetical protein